LQYAVVVDGKAAKQTVWQSLPQLVFVVGTFFMHFPPTLVYAFS
jgi:hypothetical protein